MSYECNSSSQANDSQEYQYPTNQDNDVPVALIEPTVEDQEA